MCPSGRLAVNLAEDGCYRVNSDHYACSSKCAVCESVCPFGYSTVNEDDIGRMFFADQPGIKHNDACGYYLSSVVGSCSDLHSRLNGASGGLVTAFLKQILSEGIADKVACVAGTSGGDRLFGYTILDAPDKLDSAAKSAYYPVEISDVLREIIANDAKYAIVCLPCIAKAIRLAQMRLPVLRDRIVVIAGLVCGHSVSTYFADYVASLAGAPVGSVSQVTFRIKTPSLPAGEFGTLVRWVDENGKISENTVFWSQGVGEAWTGHWFTPEPCFFCDDVFAECADISFMDAWLPEFAQDYRGTSIAIIRSERAKTAVEKAVAEGHMALSSIDLTRVLESQRDVIEFKSVRLAHRLWSASRRRHDILAKRVVPYKVKDWRAEMQWNAQVYRSRSGIQLWNKRISTESFQSQMRAIQGHAPIGVQARGWARGLLNRLHFVF